MDNQLGVARENLSIMNREKLLISGSSGRIGRILLRNLGNSFDLCGLDIAPPPANAAAHVADITDSDTLDIVFQTCSPMKYVVHLAADPRPGADWHSVLRNNILGTRNIFEAGRKHGVKRVVFASSNHVTGAYEGNPPSLHKQDIPRMISIKNEPRPDSFYGISKLSGEAIARYYFDYYGIEAVCLRIGSVVEPDDPTRNDRHLSTWLSHSDLVQLIEKSLTARNSFPGFGIYYGVSNNARSFWDISNARTELGYHPGDDASRFSMKIIATN